MSFNKHLVNIHNSTLAAVKDLKAKESQLICLLQQVDKNKVYRYCGYNSLYQYCLKALEIPDLQKDLNEGVLSVAKARRIIPLADKDNYREWSAKARSLSKRQLESEIAKINPKYNIHCHFQHMAPDLLRMQAPINQAVFEKLKRVQELLINKYKKSISVQNLLEEVLNEYLQKNDPKEKAKRKLAKLSKAPGPGQVITNQKSKTLRAAIPQKIKYQVLEKSDYKCQWKFDNGNHFIGSQ